MITSVSIENFRCFDSLTVEPLGRINLVTGLNGVGKTSLLEAMWLHHGRHNPTLLWNQNLIRTAQLQLNPLPSLARVPGGIRVEAAEEGGSTTWVTVHSSPTESVSLPIDQGGDRGLEPAQESGTAGIAMPFTDVGTLGVAAQATEELVVTFKDRDAEPVKMRGRVVMTAPGLMDVVFPDRPSLSGLPVGVLIAAGRVGIDRPTIDRFSQVLREGREQQLIDALKIVEPRLSNLGILTESGIARVWSRLGEDRMLPMESVGGGLNRLFTIFVAMGAYDEGVVFVDEIENGVHHSAMRRLWENVASFAQRFNLQFFATTHSGECIEAANDVLGSSPDRLFVLHRLYRKDESVRAEAYEGEKLKGALELELDVR